MKEVFSSPSYFKFKCNILDTLYREDNLFNNYLFYAFYIKDKFNYLLVPLEDSLFDLVSLDRDSDLLELELESDLDLVVVVVLDSLDLAGVEVVELFAAGWLVRVEEDLVVEDEVLAAFRS